ncbi:alpha-amylase family glycosyl hydrolase [Candidatus Finniella inopinata]|uniref:alpha-amylase family glycosyl hydrolase n=1 Tax=Candidatus Finniella inopinata TaxID=1696036 RepID=UPI0013EECC12|nr:alpha-amylase family glycosyl hydrolase [Candidatus Finniella inopinata]
MAVPFSAHASGSAALNGPKFFYDSTKVPTAIYHAFDLPFVKTIGTGTGKINRNLTFSDEDTTPIMNRLDSIKARGYTHIQISPPAICKPRYSKLSPGGYDFKDIWYLSYQPYVVVLDSSYQTELDAVFGQGKKTINQYGLPLSDGTIIGYRLGNSRYGSLADLKALIDAAKGNGLGIIADVVMHQISWDHGGANTNVNSMGLSDLHPIVCDSTDPTDNTFSLSGLNFPNNFFFQRGTGQYGYTTWDWGPDLNTGNSSVQTMIVNYFQLLSDIGITGIRLDGMKQLSPGNVQDIFQQAKTQIEKNGGQFFTWGHGEVADPQYNVTSPYLPLSPIEDFISLGLLQNIFAGSNQPMGFLVTPWALGNAAATAFSILHDQYPGVSTGQVATYYSNGNHADPSNIVNSQLAIAYLMATKRCNGPLLVLRFEDEKDSIAQLIERGLDFRTQMEAKNAPHEYAKALNNDVLLIGRQYGFAVINKGWSSYTLSQNDLRSNAQLPFYIPDGTYKDKWGNTYTMASGISTPKINVFFRNAAFLILQSPAGQTRACHQLNKS